MRLWASNLAIKLAFSSTYPHWHHGAVILSGSTIVSKATNHPKPMIIEGNNYSTHAEMLAIRRAKGRTAGSDIYIARVSESGEVRNSKPCKNCEKKIRSVGIRRVFYSLNSSEWVEFKIW